MQKLQHPRIHDYLNNALKKKNLSALNKSLHIKEQNIQKVIFILITTFYYLMKHWSVLTKCFSCTM